MGLNCSNSDRRKVYGQQEGLLCKKCFYFVRFYVSLLIRQLIFQAAVEHVS